MGRAIHLNAKRPKETAGWREGRPVEDPAKTKAWGVVTAKPSEFLVHVRKGRVLNASSGQGASCFKWPWDAVSIIPTSLQRLEFVADQVTLERVGVEVVGMAVYRIADPLTAYRVLNFSYPERAQEKLEAALTAMLVGATRRLVANLSVDDCLQKRKAALADELLLEVSPVLGGRGRLDDETDQGWGVVLDTVEIEEVRISSEQVFAQMQAPYRAQLEKRAAAARADAEREAALEAAESRRVIEEARIASERAVAEAESEIARRKVEIESDMKRRRTQIALEEAAEEERAHEQLVAAEALRAERQRRQQEVALELRKKELEVKSLEGHALAELARMNAVVERERAEARARVLLAEKLPELAGAVGQRFGEIKVTQIGGSTESPFGSIAQAVAGVLELARSGG